MNNPTTERIVKTPGVCGGKFCISGHRIRVLDIVSCHEDQGMTPDEIVSLFPTISLADVHTALGFYFDHMEEIREEMYSEHKLVEQSRLTNKSLLVPKGNHENMKEAS